MIGEIYNEQEEEQKSDNNKKEKNDAEIAAKKTKKLKTKICNNCKELKLKIQELEQLNSKLVQTNKGLKQSNKDTTQKLEEALKQNEFLTQENERLKKLLQELENGSNNLNKKIPAKKYQNKEESSENEEEKEKDEDKEEDKEDENEIEGRGEEESHSQSDANSNKIIVKSPKKISKLINKNLLTNEVIADILERVSELEKFRIFMEASAQTTDSKIAYLESKVSNISRKSSEDIGVPTTINSKENKMVPPLISKSLHRINEYNKEQNDDILLSKSLTNNYNYNNQKKLRNKKVPFNKKFLSENYIKSQNPNNKMNAYKFNSKILNDTNDLDLIALGLVSGDLDKLKTLKVGYKLIYRASTHGDSVKNFHKKCDNINDTLTVIKTKEGLVFGGFCNVCWESENNLEKKDLKSFVFSINLSKIYFVSEDNEASIVCDKDKGPSFIGMFTVNDNMLSSQSEINPYGTQRYSGELSLYEINGGEPTFGIEEIEVFQVFFR